MLKKIGIALAIVVILLVGAVLLVPRLIDWNDYKPDITAAVREATGRELTIAGDLDVSVLPGARFEASDVRFANAEGAEPADMATVRRIEGSVRLLPLIGGTLVVETLVVHDPVVALQVDETGRANWDFAGRDEPAGTEPDGEPSGGGSPVDEVQLDDVRIEGGQITYADARTGQRIEARDILVTAALPDMNEPLTVDGNMTLNGEPVSLNVAVDTPGRLVNGERAAVTAAIDSQRLMMSYEGGVQQEPVPGLDGTFELQIPSAGELAAWLDRPLPDGQPDPGPIEARAVFEADGGRVAIREATLQGGEALQANATGLLDISGEAPRLSLQVESGVLDIDRYLPPQTRGAADGRSVAGDARPGGEENIDLLADISDEPFDLSVLQNGEADVRVSIGGIKAAGYEVGESLFVARLEGGVLTADLEQLRLYDGDVTGSVRLDATDDALAMNADLDVAGVRTGELGAAATGGDSPVVGVVSADLEAAGEGRSPRGLVESLSGRLAVDLGGLDLGDAAPGAISGLRIDLDLPGLDRSPVLEGSVVYNQERVDFEATTDPLPVVLSADRFALDADVSSRPVTVRYQGGVLRSPVAGLDGTFELAVPSVGRLAAWLGRPLGADQPDPGPLQARAVFVGESGEVTIREAVVEGESLNAEASGSWAQEGDTTRLALQVRAGVIDLDRYLPKPPDDGGTAPDPGAAGQAGGGSFLDSLSDQPLDLSALRSLDADVDVTLDGLKVSGHEIGRTAVSAAVENGVLTAEIADLAIYRGEAKGRLSVDASRDSPSYQLTFDLADVALAQAMRAGGDEEAAVEGTLSATVEAAGSGASPRSLAAGTSAEVDGTIQGAVVPGETPRRIERADFRASIPGFDEPMSAGGDLVYENESVTVALDLDPASRILGGQRFAAKVSVESERLTAQYDGVVQQQPVAGLDGRMSLNVPAVGRLLAWLGQPLPSGQAEPGPLEVVAVLTADGPRIAIEEASIQGEALRASANASYDGAGETPRIEARLAIEQADLDAYLPPADGGDAGGDTERDASGGWSTEPLDLSALSAAEGTVQVDFGGVRYRGLDVQNGRIRSELSQGVLNATIERLELADGTVAGEATVDGSGEAAAINYDLTVSGVNARPLLRAFADTGRLSGRTEFRMNGSARGATQRDLVSSLNGEGELRFFDGAIHGVNLAALLRQVGSLGLRGGEEQKTDFAELGGTFTIENGLLENRDLRMLAPLIRLSGGGTADMPARTIDYRVEANLVASLEGQGGDEALAGLPVPIRIGGTFDNPTYDIDWKSVLQAAARDPERLKNMPADLLNAAEDFGVNLKGLGGSDGVGDILKSLPGGGGAEGQAPTGERPSSTLDPLRQLFGGNRAPSEGSAGEDAAGEGAAEGTTQEPPPPDERQNPVDQLRGLFGR